MQLYAFFKCNFENRIEAHLLSNFRQWPKFIENFYHLLQVFANFHYTYLHSSFCSAIEIDHDVHRSIIITKPERVRMHSAL